MPGMRYIEVPSPIALVNPATKLPLDEKPVAFADVVEKLMFNPLWNQSYVSIRAADAINEALETAKGGVVTLAEEDWMKLRAAVETPKMVSGSQVADGLGYHPIIVRQLLPHLRAIMEAKDKAPEQALRAVE